MFVRIDGPGSVALPSGPSETPAASRRLPIVDTYEVTAAVDPRLAAQIQQAAVAKSLAQRPSAANSDVAKTVDAMATAITKHAGNADAAIHAAVQIAATSKRVAFWPLYERVVQEARTLVARHPYRAALLIFRRTLDHAGQLVRKYITAQEPDANSARWQVLEELHRHGKFTGAFGHVVHDGTVEVMSKVFATRSLIQHLDKQVMEIGRDLQLTTGEVIKIRKPKVSATMNISGMSFPQLTARSILSLLYAHLKMAKDGAPGLFNTGEGGPNMHLALLHGDRQKLKDEVIAWGVRIGEIKPGDHAQAKIEVFIDKLMQERDALFAEFSDADLKGAQIVAQFGTALNGVRDPNHRIDFDKLDQIGADPHVAMVEFKLKQAAKRGSKLDMSKVDLMTAAMRLVEKNKAFQSPAISPEMQSYEDIATLVVATKLVTRKPVSLKFGVGDLENLYEFLEYLARVDALPDHIQIDGSGTSFSPGSGNAPPTGTMGNTSLTARDATLATDLVLKNLGVRDLVRITTSGDVVLPTDGVLALALGADGIAGARTWMGIGLGCSKVKACDNGTCPYGIASKGDSVFALSMDPLLVGPKAYTAATQWRQAYLSSLAETGSMDWRTQRMTHGLHARKTTVRIRADGEQVSLRDVYHMDRLMRLFGNDILDRAEVQRAAYGYMPEEYVAYATFDTMRRAEKLLDGLAPHDSDERTAFDVFKAERLDAIRQHVEAAFLEGRELTGRELRELLRAELPHRSAG